LLAEERQSVQIAYNNTGGKIGCIKDNKVNNDENPADKMPVSAFSFHNSKLFIVNRFFVDS
jgi:hypothetical protein